MLKKRFVFLYFLNLIPLIAIGRQAFVSVEGYVFWFVWQLCSFSVALIYRPSSKNSMDYQQETDLIIDNLREIQQEDQKQVKELTTLLNEMNHQEKVFEQKIQHLKEVHHKQESEYVYLHQDLQSQMSKKDRALSESRITIKEQRLVIEKKQEEINVLKMQLQDVRYSAEDFQLPISEEFPNGEPQVQQAFPSNQRGLCKKLQGYIDVMVHLSRLSPFNQSSSRTEMTSSLLDQRRLFDHLQCEDSDVILIYSYSKRRIVFINQRVKALLGWGPEKFIEDFQGLIQKGLSQWKETLDGVRQGEQREVRLLMKRRSGENILTNCYLKMVPQGPFEGHALGILSSAAMR